MYVSESKLVRQPHIEPHKEIRVMRILLESGSVGENDNRTEGCYLRILMMQCIFNMMIWIFFTKDMLSINSILCFCIYTFDSKTFYF